MARDRKPSFKLNPSQDFMQPTAGTGICQICTEPLGAESHFITDYPHGEHVRCQKTRARGNPFPYAQELAELREQAAALGSCYRNLVDFGRWLVAMRDGWPETRGEVEREYRKLRESVKKAVGELRVKLN